MSGKKFVGIDELCTDLKENYSGAFFRDWSKNYRVTDIDTGTTGAVLEKLKGFLNKRDVKIIFLVAEETDG